MFADGERGAILRPRGDIARMCMPRGDGDAVFSSLVGGRGVYAVTQAEPFVWGGYYEPESLIWVSRWTTATGIIECRDALAYPGDPGRAVLLRRIVAREGDATVDVVLDPRAHFGHTAATTSLPERAHAGRNYDYRYAWIRDQCYAGIAAAKAGLPDLMRDAVRFVGARLRADGDHLMPASTTAGGPIPDLRRVGLPGYPGGFDLIGNRVVGQFQLEPTVALPRRPGCVRSPPWPQRPDRPRRGSRWPT